MPCANRRDMRQAARQLYITDHDIRHLQTYSNVELRRRILFTLAMIVVVVRPGVQSRVY